MSRRILIIPRDSNVREVFEKLFNGVGLLRAEAANISGKKCRSGGDGGKWR